MKCKVIGMEKHPTAQTDMKSAKAGETVGLLLEKVVTIEEYGLGPEDWHDDITYPPG
jgi:hypothetical protein